MRILIDGVEVPVGGSISVGYRMQGPKELPVSGSFTGTFTVTKDGGVFEWFRWKLFDHREAIERWEGEGGRCSDG